MKSPQKHVYLFDILANLTAVLVMLFILVALSSIVVKGFPYIGEAFLSEEVRFAVKLSLYTSSVSTLVGNTYGLCCYQNLAALQAFF